MSGPITIDDGGLATKDPSDISVVVFDWDARHLATSVTIRDVGLDDHWCQRRHHDDAVDQRSGVDSERHSEDAGPALGRRRRFEVEGREHHRDQRVAGADEEPEVLRESGRPLMNFSDIAQAFVVGAILSGLICRCVRVRRGRVRGLALIRAHGSAS
jgi:hypothetical protein